MASAGRKGELARIASDDPTTDIDYQGTLTGKALEEEVGTHSARGTRGGPPMDVTGTTGVAAGTYDTMGQGSDATRKDNPNDMGAGAGYTGGAMGAIGVRTFEAPETRSNSDYLTGGDYDSAKAEGDKPATGTGSLIS